MSIQYSRLGWKPDLPDHRDLLYSAVRPPKALPLPPHVDLTSQCPPVYDQLTLGSCTANAGGGMTQFLQMKFNLTNFIPSRLFIYWNSRLLIGETDVDQGATLRDTLKVVVNKGLPRESLWWYNPAKYAVKPNKAVYAAALKHKIGQYFRIDNSNLNEMKQCLADGFPFILGFSVYESFLSDKVASTGEVPMPSPVDSLVGGHAVMAVGYDDAKLRFILRNSWGGDWGVKGYFTMPYEYLTNTNLADDFWTARSIT